MKTLVTGAAGFIGSTLSGRLLDAGAEVTGIDCFTDYYPRPIKEANLEALTGRRGFTFVEASLQAADLGRLLDGVTHVFHLAAQAGVRRSWGRDFAIYTALNVDSTQVLLEACVGKPLHRLVYASSSSVYGAAESYPTTEDMCPGPVSPYGVTKLAAEHLAQLYHRNHGLATVSLRFFTVYGPRQRPDMAFHRFLKAARDGRPITVYGDGSQTRDFTYVANVVDANLRALTAKGLRGQTVNVATGKRISLLDLHRELSRELGVRLAPERRPARAGDIKHSQAAIAAARRLLGYRPIVSFRDGVRLTAEWYRGQTVPHGRRRARN